MEIRYMCGDVLDWADKVDVIGHQVNCVGIMGGGVALQIANKWPIVFDEYRENFPGRPNVGIVVRKDLMGTCQVVSISDSCSVANLFGQLDVGGEKRLTSYFGLLTALGNLKEWMVENNKTKLALPYGIGCGIGGGDWTKVRYLIELAFEETDIQVTFVNYSK